MKTNKINTYTCPSNHLTVTRDLDRGITPLSKNCPVCGQPAKSGGYVDDLQSLPPTHEWYKPKFPERYPDKHMRQYINKGALAFRLIGGPDETELLAPIASRQIMSALTNKKNGSR